MIEAHLANLLIYAIRMYQKYLSKFSRGSCRYAPTCSQYAIQAIQKHGTFKGAILTIRRILRCRPSYGGFDPIE